MNPDLTGLLIAALFGFILPGGPITIYPVAGALLVMGADAGAVVAFIVSWTLIGYTRALVWELPFFGSEFVIWRIVAALPLPIIAGLLARMAVRAGFRAMRAQRRDSMTLAINILLWLVVGGLALFAAMRGRVLLNDGLRDGALEFILLLPRIGIGVVGSGFVAEVLPKALIAPVARPGIGAYRRHHRDARRRAHAGRAGGRLFHRRRRAQERRRRAAGDRLFHRLGALCDPPAADLGDAADAGAHRLAARGGVAAAAVHGGRGGDVVGKALIRITGKASAPLRGGADQFLRCRALYQAGPGGLLHWNEAIFLAHSGAN